MENDMQEFKIESSEELIANTKLAVEEWNLGPVNVDAENPEFWAKVAEIRGVEVAAVKRQLCANCEYYNNTPAAFEQMETIPLNQFDIYNSQAQRGYCHKLHFICHTPRTCQAWEEKDYWIPADTIKQESKDHAAIMFGE